MKKVAFITALLVLSFSVAQAKDSKPGKDQWAEKFSAVNDSVKALVEAKKKHQTKAKRSSKGKKSLFSQTHQSASTDKQINTAADLILTDPNTKTTLIETVSKKDYKHFTKKQKVSEKDAVARSRK